MKKLLLPLAASALQACIVLPPDVSDCHLFHGFVLGEAWAHPGAIEIWQCERSTVVTLIEFRGPRREQERRLRSYFSAELGPGELLVGCREGGRYAGLVGVTSEQDNPQPRISRAWRADLDRWTFEETDAATAACDRRS